MSVKFTKKKNDIWMNQLTKTIEQNLQTPHLTNAKLAMLTQMSERQFYRKVEELTGLSPNRYIRKIRLQKAVELLRSGQFNTVKEVALRVGFTKVSYFSQLYQRKEGKRPSEVLNQETNL